MKYRVEASCGEGVDICEWGTLQQALKTLDLLEDTAKLMKESNVSLDEGRHALKELGGHVEPLQRRSETWTAKVVDENHKVYRSKSWVVRIIV